MKVGLIQLNSGQNKKNNIHRTCSHIDKAIDGNAKLIVLPEVYNYRGPLIGSDLYDKIAENIPGESTQVLMEIAKNNNVWILCGSLYEKGPNKKIYNSSIVINNKGEIIAKYRKIHLFKAIIDGTIIDESEIFISGKEPVVVDINDFKIGLSICFDLRFPELYRNYYNNKVDVITVPSSFTYKTGKDHWEPLLRARAIENQCYVLAPNQFGIDGNNVNTYGHTMFVDYYGKIKVFNKEEEGVLFGYINKLNDKRDSSIKIDI